MQQDVRSIAAATPVQPLGPCELITDSTLRALAQGDPDRQRGIISPEDQAILVMILPDLCGELLARRAAMGDCADLIESDGFITVHPHLPFPSPRNHAEEIANARAGIDADQSERIEGLAQHACDELAEANVRMGTLEDRTAAILDHLKGHAA